MIKLLRAGFYRLKKEKLFWIFIIVSILVAGYMFTLKVNSIDGIVNNYLAFIGLLIAIFVSIFVGKEHSEGIIRNKIIVRTYKKKNLLIKFYYKCSSIIVM